MVDRPLRRAMLIHSASPALFLESSEGTLDPPSNEDAPKTRYAYSATTALVAGGGVAFHIAADVWISHILGAVAVFDRSGREVLDGTERLSSAFPDLEIGSRSPDPVPAF